MERHETVNIKLKQSEDGSSVELSIVKFGLTLACAEICTPELDGLIHSLGKVRANMPDIVPMELEPHAISVGLDDPPWRTHAPRNPPYPSIILSVRHPAFGWVSALLPIEGARTLAGSLSQIADALQPPA